MPEALSISIPLILTVVLVISAIGKLRDPDRAAAAFKDLRVPKPISSSAVIAAHPWAEILLGIVLFTAGGWLGVAAAIATLGLMLVYLALVVRAVQMGVDVDCACFGSFGGNQVNGRTVWRNLWLVILATVGLWESGGRSALQGVISGDAWWWVGALLAAGLTAVLVLADGVAGGVEATHGKTAGIVATEDDLEDYVRVRTPAVPVTLANGTTRTLRELSSRRAQLLLFVSEWCGSCQPVIDAVPRWREEMPSIDVRLVIRGNPTDTRLSSTAEPMTAHDTKGWAAESIGSLHTPAAVLLGADGLLAGGPVIGNVEIPNFVMHVQEQLSA